MDRAIKHLRIALGQVNVTVGDLEGNVEKIMEYISRARDMECHVVAFPELAIPGYPPEDLLLKPQFIEENIEALHHLASRIEDITVVVGFVDAQDDIYNAAAIIHEGEIKGIYRKMFLPNYGVFDENRYFQQGQETPVFVINGTIVGVNICEDIWYAEGPILAQCLGGGAEVILNISSSPFHAGKRAFRERMLSVRASDNCAIVAYTNLVGGQDELVFDGASMVFDEGGQLLAQARIFQEDLLIVDLNVESVFRTRLHDPRRRKEKLAFSARVPVIPISGPSSKPLPPLEPRETRENLSREEEITRALIVGTRDYIRKNGFQKVVIGLSGGIDSSLVAAIAAEALGPENVIGVLMPSQYSSESSITDALDLARNLGIKTYTIPIQNIFDQYRKELGKEVFQGLEEDVTEENIQARIRGNLLMAMSNKFGWIVLATGNKSEMSCGYATLYGDMAGGFAVIKDVFKTTVYKIARHINNRANREIIPENVFVKPPSAELRPDQTDQDTLPPYEILDPILEAYVEKDKSFQEIVAMGFDPAIVKRVITMVDRNEYKRRQAPPGIKITPRAFGRDRRLPITNRYRPFQK